MSRRPEFIVTKLATSGGFRHIAGRFRSLALARAFVKAHNLKQCAFSPRIYRRIE